MYVCTYVCMYVCMYVCLFVCVKVAINEAKLGEMEDFMKCLQLADILKPAKTAAEELVKNFGYEVK